MTDETWWQLLLAFGFGLAGSVLPLANAEAFIVASVATGVLGPVPVGVLLGAGQGVGKMLVFQGIRQGRRQLVRRRPRREPAPIRPGPGGLAGRGWSSGVSHWSNIRGGVRLACSCPVR